MLKRREGAADGVLRQVQAFSAVEIGEDVCHLQDPVVSPGERRMLHRFGQQFVAGVIGCRDLLQ